MVLHLWCSRLRWMVSSITVRYSAAFIYLSILLMSAAAKLKRLYSSNVQKLFIIAATRLSVTDEEAELEMAEVDGRREELKAFVQFLNDKCSFAFNIDNFSHRIKLQKYVFIAKLLGWDCPRYTYNIYIRGPYSPNLADDYYRLGASGCSSYDFRGLFPGFDQDKFIQIVKGKSVGWLEVATTLLSIYNNNKQQMAHDELISFAYERTVELKRDYGKDYVTDVLDDQLKYGLLSPN